ncbi:hypothetical protein ACFFGH_32375 [Lysobacter korlensis]|uniref:Uncharacterized protein n=1 Tax=Lysobacter korlensis TaxID=553636 RepID=A0ABV6RZZ2_9GAMM
MAWVSLEVSIPEGSRFTLRELGFVFRAPNGPAQSRFLAFPNFPIVSSELTPDGKAAIFAFALHDPPEGWDQPFSLELEAFAINGGLQVGPATRIRIGPVKG